MSYSKVKRMRVINFRSIGSVDIDMTDAPIIALTGSNESGKTSFIKAFGAVAGNLWRTKQNQYVRTGTDGFGIVLELEDGTKIMRKRTQSVNGYTLVLPNGQRRDANKIDVETPDFIDAVMGLSRDPETKESLQVRTYDDPLLFVTTTDGQNYKVLHNAISNLDVREATVKAKEDATKLLKDAEARRSEIEVYNRQLSEMPLLDTEYLKVVLAALERASTVSEKYDEALQALELSNTLDGDGAARQLKKCKTVDAEVTRVFGDAMRNLDSYKNIDVVDFSAAKTVDTVPLSLFERARSLLADVKTHAAKEVPASVQTISSTAVPLFERALQSIAVVLEAGESITKLADGIEKVSAVLKESGMQVISCDKCGNDMVIPVAGAV